MFGFQLFSPFWSHQSAVFYGIAGNLILAVQLLRVAFQDSFHSLRVWHILFLVPVDGNWSDWEPKLACGYAVYNYYRYFNRKCNNPAPSGGGLPCPGKSKGKAYCYLKGYVMVSNGIVPRWFHANRRIDWPAIASLQGLFSFLKLIHCPLHFWSFFALSRIDDVFKLTYLFAKEISAHLILRRSQALTSLISKLPFVLIIQARSLPDPTFGIVFYLRDTFT